MAHPVKHKDAPPRRVPARSTRRLAVHSFSTLPGGAPPATPEAWLDAEGSDPDSSAAPRNVAPPERTDAVDGAPAYHRERERSLADLGRGMIHQFRNQLCVVTGGLHAGLAHATPDSARELLLLAENATRKMVRLLDDLMTLTQRPNLQLTPLVPRLFFDRLLKIVEPRLKARSIHLERRFAPGPPAFWGDPATLTEAFEGLIQNALEALPAGGRVLLETRWSPGAGFLNVRLSDNGRGMSAEERERAFQPYFTTKTGAGGLGLTLARRVMEFHGGTVRLDSAPGEGTTVSLFFPVPG
ncbi:MAG: HAMP domain-containing histidine kinase [Elusimicrobia bacterium]|nr:HAMP domain-containing histidine kinase [Elusimicrobiota bacterium]